MHKGPIALGTIRTSFVLFLRLLIQAGTLLLVARMLGPENFGAFAAIASLAVLLGTLSTFGTNLVLLGAVSKNPCKRNDVLSYAIPTTLFCGSVLLIIYLSLAYWVLPSSAVLWQVLIAIGFSEVVVQPLFGLMSTEHHAHGRVARAQLMQNSPLAIRLLVAAGIYILDLTPALSIYALGYLAASMLVLLLGTYYLPQKWPDWQNWRLPRISEWNQAIGYAVINISKAGPAELDKTLAIKLLPTDAVGIYAAGARVVGSITLPITAMTLSALPRLFRDIDQRCSTATYLIKWMYGVAIIYSFILSGFLWLTAPVIESLFGAQYQGMYEVIRWLCLAIPGMALRLVAGNSLMAMGRPWLRIGFETIGLSILVIVGILLVEDIGLRGMAFAVVCSEWGMAITGVIIIIYDNKKSPTHKG